MTTPTDVTFSTHGHSGDLELAVNHSPSSRTGDVPHIMFCGGFHSAMQGTKGSALSTLCREHDWHYTRFDYRGHGQSGGDPAGFTLADWLDDTLAILDQQQMPTVLVGSSMGAWLATLAGLRRPDSVKALMLIAAAPDFVQELVVPNLSVAEVWDLQQGQIVDRANDYDTPHPITQALLDSAKPLSLLDGEVLQTLHCPIRLIHGTGDTDVPYELAARLMDKLPPQHDARLSLLHDADHRLSDERSLSYIEQELITLINTLYEQS
ncbi:MAG: alpha/beta fold hydrolase [Granulosicoccus sp.]